MKVKMNISNNVWYKKLNQIKKRLIWYNLRLLYQVVMSDEMSCCIYVYEIPKIKNGTTTDNIYLEV